MAEEAGTLNVGLSTERILTNISLFSGVAGFDLGAKETGRIKTVAYCEWDPYAQGVLKSRIKDGSIDDAPIWDDVCSFDGKPWRGAEIVSGGFPCQDVSVAGKKEGLREGTRSGLFYELMRICREVGPRFIYMENVTGLLVYPGAHRVFGELADLGYDAGWKVISASDVGGPTEGKRVWIVAQANGFRRNCLEEKQKNGCSSFNFKSFNAWEARPTNLLLPLERAFSKPSSGFKRVDNGLWEGMERLKRCGNGVIPKQSIPGWSEIIRLYDLEI